MKITVPEESIKYLYENLYNKTKDTVLVSNLQYTIKTDSIFIEDSNKNIEVFDISEELVKSSFLSFYDFLRERKYIEKVVSDFRIIDENYDAIKKNISYNLEKKRRIICFIGNSFNW